MCVTTNVHPWSISYSNPHQHYNLLQKNKQIQTNKNAQKPEGDWCAGTYEHRLIIKLVWKKRLKFFLKTHSISPTEKNWQLLASSLTRKPFLLRKILRLYGIAFCINPKFSSTESLLISVLANNANIKQIFIWSMGNKSDSFY